ncbi:MAG: serine protein kinase RIO [Proteobacteria bacterium]|nr:serine protein kinase RIO [Pseudomonadota bacterium]MCP4922336.1 serine protein kinase RIO [Pseudomonadota bacterium]
MRVPPSLVPLVEEGVIDEVIRPLMSGKEAQVYLVRSGTEQRVAKVYKESTNRSFKHRSDYTEGRKTRSSRGQRAMDKRSKYGRQQAEAAWRTAEVDAIYRLHGAGVRVPEPFEFHENVLVMELIDDGNGGPAPRLVDIELERRDARGFFDFLLQEVVKMLCAGLVHGDLSDFNVLIGPDGPVIIDFPQVVDPAFNRNARKLLIRDVDNLTSFFSRWLPKLRRTKYGPEMWALYEKGELRPDSQLTGKWNPKLKKANAMSLLDEIEEMERENREKRERLGLPPPRPARKPVEFVKPPPARKEKKKLSSDDEPRGESKRSRRRRRGRSGPPRDEQRRDAPRVETRASPPSTASSDAPKKKRRRRRPRKKPTSDS